MRRSWSRVIADHRATVTDVISVILTVPEESWNRHPAPRKWSAAEEALHIVLAYEVGLAALRGQMEMVAISTPFRAFILRWLVLPVITRTDWFPRARAPREVAPETSGPDSVSRETIVSRLEAVGEELSRELAAAAQDGSSRRIGHPYFGPLRVRTAALLMSAHTRHHRRRLARG
jgi:hypothetical protein